jgi:16S rRNA (adenine1518-N6/adenine1519-N6)-dimethyltransferase
MSSALLPPLSEQLKASGLWPDKKFGQHFLLDSNITDKIVRAASIDPHTLVIEVGPGPGGLTRSILAQSPACHVVAIETDKRFVEFLQPLKTIYASRADIISHDALKINWPDLCAQYPHQKAVVISNLPYNVGTALWLDWLNCLDIFSDFILMFQREVAERLSAQVGDGAYGRLSIITQAQAQVHKVFDLAPDAFYPPPQVWSRVVHITPLAQRPSPAILKQLAQLTHLAFQQRRKMLRQSLKPYVPFLESLGIATTMRAEELPVATWLKLAEAVLAANKA